MVDGRQALPPTNLPKPIDVLDWRGGTRNSQYFCHECEIEFWSKPNYKGGSDPFCPWCRFEKSVDDYLDEKDAELLPYRLKLVPDWYYATRLRKFQCLDCDSVFELTHDRPFRSREPVCRTCYPRSKFNRITHEQYVHRLNEVHGGRIKALTKYTGIMQYVLHQCECGHKWCAAPNTLVNCRFGCQVCGRKRAAQKTGTAKTVKLAGKRFTVQGYEDRALRYLAATGADVHNLKTSFDPNPYSFTYRFEGKTRTHFPDFYNTSTGEIFEVKSPGTMVSWMHARFTKVCAKFKAAKRRGLRYTMLVMDEKGRLCKLPRRWWRLSEDAFRDQLYRLNHGAR